jgi:ribosomal protein L37AE/L43A
MSNSDGTEHQEHPTPTCPNCGGQQTRPLDRTVAVCFDCDIDWRDEEADWDV